MVYGATPRQTRQLVSSARNAGILQSKGEYIAFLDADDLWLPTKLEKQIDYLDTHPDVGLISTRVNIVDSRAQYVRSFTVPTKESISLAELLSYNYILCGSTPVVRRTCFKTAGLFDAALSSAADWDMWIRIGLHYKIASILENLVCYRKHTNNMSSNVEKMATEIAKILEKSKLILAPDNCEIINRRYGVCMLEAAWYMSTCGKYRKAIRFSIKAFSATPDVALSWSFAKLYLFIFAKKVVNQQQYNLLIRFHKTSKRLIMPKAK